MATKVIEVTSLITADECLAEIASVSRQIKRIETERDEKIDEIKLEVQEDLLELRERIDECEVALNDFGEANPELFVKPRSHKLDFGTLGFNEGTKLETDKKWTWKKVINKLLKIKKRSALRFTPSVNKDRLKKWTVGDLKKIGVIKTTEDHFSYSLTDEGER